MLSDDYDEKIKQLFEEGKRLGAPSLAEYDSNSSGKDRSLPGIQMSDLQPDFARNLSAPPAHHFQALSPEIPQPIFPAFSFNTNTNNNFAEMPVLPPRAQQFKPVAQEISTLIKTKSNLERTLDDSQAQVQFLTKKLAESKEVIQTQKEHFRKSIEDLQRKLQENVAGRKQLMEVKQNDMRQQEDMIHRLQTTIKELAASNQMQEQTLLDAHERINILQNRNQSTEQAMGNIRTILSTVQQKDSRTRVLDSDHISELVPEMLVQSLERFVTNAQGEADSLRCNILRLEAELNGAKQEHEAEQLVLRSDTEDLVKKLKLQHQNEAEKFLKQERELKDKVNQLTSELGSLSTEHAAKLRHLEDACKQVTELNRQLNEIRQVVIKDKGEAQVKFVNSDYDLRVAKDHAARLEKENELLQKRNAELTKLLEQVNKDLNTEKEQRRNLWMRESDCNKDLNDIRSLMEDRNNEITRLREQTTHLREELTSQVAANVKEAEIAERAKGEAKAKELTQEMGKIREQLSRTEAEFHAMERQLSDVIMERSKTLEMLQEKDQQVDRLNTQFNLTDRKLVEVTEAKRALEEKFATLQKDYDDVSVRAMNCQNDLERTRSFADDKEKISMALRHQVEMKTSSLEAAVKAEWEATSKNKSLEIRLKEMMQEIEKLSSDLKSRDAEIADYESRISELLEEKGSIGNDVRMIEEEVARVVRSKEEMAHDLKEARFQVSHLIQERDSLSKEIKYLKKRFDDEMQSVKKELKQKKKDLDQIQETMQTVKSVDGKAAKIAENMQKELTAKRAVIDSLQTELSKVYDKLEIAQKESKAIKKEAIKMTKKLEVTSAALKSAEEELKKKAKSEKGYQMAVERLRSGLEKAAERNNDAQTVIERQDAELTQARIKHNLNLMDRRLPNQQVEQPVSTNIYGRPNLHNSGTGTLQNLLTRALTSMTAQPPQRDISVNEIPKSQIQASKDDSKMASDIYKMLAEVHENLVKKERKSPKSPRYDVTKSRRHRRRRRSNERNKAFSSGDESSELDVVQMNSDVTSVCSEPTSYLFESTFKQENISPRKFNPSRDFGDKRPLSPVSMLLHEAGDCSLALQKRVLQEQNQGSDQDARDRFVSSAIKDNAEELCRQLQQRLEGLTKMGGKLEKQNKDAAKLMKKQDRKLQQVRASEQNLR